MTNNAAMPRWKVSISSMHRKNMSKNTKNIDASITRRAAHHFTAPAMHQAYKDLLLHTAAPKRRSWHHGCGPDC